MVCCAMVMVSAYLLVTIQAITDVVATITWLLWVRSARFVVHMQSKQLMVSAHLIRVLIKV